MNSTTSPDFDQPVNRQATDAAKYDARRRVFGNKEVQPLWVADMDLPVPPFLQDALIKRIQHPCLGYTVQSSALKESVQWWMESEHGCLIDTAAICFSPSVVTSMSNAIAAFTKKGEGIALFSPVYERFYSSIINQNRTVINIPLLLDRGRYNIDFAAFDAACSTGKLKMLLFCNPQNPSGRVWQQDELTELVRICSKHGVIIFADEIHSDIIYAPKKHTSLLTINGAEKSTLLAHSIGKTFNTSGLQGSFACIPDQHLRARFRLEAKRTHTGDINLLAKIAMKTLFSREGQQYKKALSSYLAINRDLAAKRLAPLNTLSMMLPESTFLAWLDFRKTGLSHDELFSKLIKEASLGLGSGRAYGPAGEGWFRLNFAVTSTHLEKAIAKLETTFG